MEKLMVVKSRLFPKSTSKLPTGRMMVLSSNASNTTISRTSHRVDL